VFGLPALQGKIPNRHGLKQGRLARIVWAGKDDIITQFEAGCRESLKELNFNSGDHIRAC
jgi:hypothetical protein